MKNKYKNVIIAGGGTGGHLFPALAIADEIIKHKNYNVIFFGSKYGIESNFFSKYPMRYHLLNIRGIQRSTSFKSFFINFVFPYRFIHSLFKTFFLFLKIDPILVIGTGGYASGIPLIVATMMKKKIIIQEQNSIPGFTTQKLSRYAQVTCTAYQQAKKKLTSRTMLTGNPVRLNLNVVDNKEAKKTLSLNNSFTLLVVGGSQGAKSINDFMIQNSHKINSDINIIWQCGEKNYDAVKTNKISSNIRLLPYIDDIDIAYSAADLVVSRAGALALSEISLFKKAMIIIPLANSAQNHQLTNARYYESNNAAIVVEESQLSKLVPLINKLIDSDKIIKDLEENIDKISKPNANKEIYSIIDSIIRDQDV